MTNKEAITYLEWLSNIDFRKKHPTYTMVTNPDQVEALKMAITALEISDSISQQLDCKEFHIKLNNSNEQLNNSTLIKTNVFENRVKGMTACRVPEDETISRQAAIDGLMKRDKALRNINWYDKPYAEGECKGIDEALDIIIALPSAQLDIVRCCKCSYWDRDSLRHQCNDFRDWNEAECKILAERDPYDEINRYTEADDYCSRAERRYDG